MRPTLYGIGTCLALLALGLQVAVCAIGGRVCYQASAQPTTAVPCASACCHDDEPVAPTPWFADLTELPGQTTDSDCCLQPSPEHACLATSRTPHLTPDLVAPLPVAMPLETLVKAPSREVAAPTWTASLPPPSLPQVRTTVLLI